MRPKPDAAYLLNGALAKYLAPAKGWDEKLQRLLALMGEIPAEGEARALLLGAIDSLVAEMLNGSRPRSPIFSGHNPDLGHALLNLVELFLGATVNTAEGAGDRHQRARALFRLATICPKRAPRSPGASLPSSRACTGCRPIRWKRN